jgi:hypothetical protein
MIALKPSLNRAQLEAQASALNSALVTFQDRSGFLLKRFTVRTEPDDILPFKTLEEAKAVLDREMQAAIPLEAR